MAGHERGRAGRRPARPLVAAAAWGLAAALSVAAGTPSGTADELEAAAHATAVRVGALTAEYTRRSDEVNRAAEQLASAFSISAEAQSGSDDAERELRHARSLRAERIRALYTDGAMSLAVMGLGAQSAQDALWQLSTGSYLRGRLLRSADAELAQVEQRADLAALRSGAADVAGARLAAALGTLQEASAAAARALALAEQALDQLRRSAADRRTADAAAAALAAARARAETERLAAGTVTALGIPDAYAQTYRSAAGSCPGLRWSVLAAVGQVESGHGRNPGPSSAGAVGPMQFMPATFALYSVDGDHDGRTDPWDAGDAIWTAAHYLCVSGAGDGTDAGLQRALFTYNHAQWYVDLVLAAEQAIVRAGAAGQAGGAPGPPS